MNNLGFFSNFFEIYFMKFKKNVEHKSKKDKKTRIQREHIKNIEKRNNSNVKVL